MMHLLLLTIALRPYVFVFLGCYLVIAVVNFGVRTTILFTALSYTVALASEWSSIHNGLPFGLYHYVQTTRGSEIWVAGVPFMDSISFTFLAFVSYTVALLLSAPLHRGGYDVRTLDTWALRRSARVWLLGALFMVMVDTAVDPLSVLGNRWFLGRIFWYDPPGPHFGVPISNYVGWYLVAAVTIAIFQWIDAWLNRGAARPAGSLPTAPSRALWGPALYLGIVSFGIVMLFRIHAEDIAWASVFIFVPVIALALHIVMRAENWGDAVAVERHLIDFPYERSLGVWRGFPAPRAASRRGEA
jgi:uncharacterized membrane protein